MERVGSFGKDELEVCRKGEQILGLGLELTRRCNLKCSYCYADAGKPLNNELSLKEIKDIINEAIRLGVKRIGIIGGGEPLLWPNIHECLDILSKIDVEVTLFTNGILMNQELACTLYKGKFKITQKLNSLIPDVQDRLCGASDVFVKIMRSIEFLQKAGYPDNGRRLAVETVVVPENYSEIPKIWRWARNKRIEPVVERLTPQGRARNMHAVCTASEVRNLYERLADIDRNEFGIYWTPRPPCAGPRSCQHHLYALYVRSDGIIQPCSGVEIQVGSTRTGGLREAMKSPLISGLRNIRDTIQGKCKSCKLSAQCYGCRGAAFWHSGNPFSEDPFCWLDGS
jgi:radical SAM protein with 4Fe4S-binding SPASM domain